MKELASYLVKQLADSPESVDIQASEEGDATRLGVKVAESDKGKIIGKQGKVIKAIRQLVGIPATKAGRKVFVDLE